MIKMMTTIGGAYLPLPVSVPKELLLMHYLIPSEGFSESYQQCMIHAAYNNNP